MKYDPKTELSVFAAVKELGEATKEEILEYLTKQEKITIEPSLVERYLRRWKAKKIVAANLLHNRVVWKLADIPPWYMSGIMAIVKGSVNSDMRTAMEALDERLKNQGRIIQPRGVYGNYKSLLLTFETLDPILGGRISGQDRNLVFPKDKEGNLLIPTSWLFGWIRDNAALINLPKSIAYHVAWSHGTFCEQPKLIKKTLKVKMGLCTYEAIPEGTRFQATARFPFKGTQLKKKEQLTEFFELLAIAPLRGLGAYPRAFGGRVKLVEMKEIA